MDRFNIHSAPGVNPQVSSAIDGIAGRLSIPGNKSVDVYLRDSPLEGGSNGWTRGGGTKNPKIELDGTRNPNDVGDTFIHESEHVEFPGKTGDLHDEISRNPDGDFSGEKFDWGHFTEKQIRSELAFRESVVNKMTELGREPNKDELSRIDSLKNALNNHLYGDGKGKDLNSNTKHDLATNIDSFTEIAAGIDGFFDGLADGLSDFFSMAYPLSSVIYQS